MDKKTRALKLALDVLTPDPEEAFWFVEKKKEKAITALRAALAEQPAQPQQEPEIVQRVKRRTGKTIRTARNPNITARECIELADWIAANTSPPASKPWVGLTDEESAKIPAWIYSPDQDGMTAEEGLETFARAIEAKLKEKNNG